MFNLWGSGSSTPKRNSTLKPPPLTPKLTTTSPASDYPPLAQDAQWEHIKHGSPSSPDVDDETALERLGYSQIDSGDPLRGLPAQVPRWLEERDQLREQLEVSLTAQRKAESDRDHWERKVMELRSSIRADRESAKNRREWERIKEREPSMVDAEKDALKEEKERLKTLLERRTQELNIAQEGRKQEYSQSQADTERLKKELDGARVVHDETEALKTSLREHVQRVEFLSAERDRVRKERESIREQLDTEIERLKSTHAKELEQVKTALDEVNQDRTQAHSELRKVRKSLDAYAPRLDECLREIDNLRQQLSAAKESHRVAADWKQRLEIQGKELQSAREESSALNSELRKVRKSLDAYATRLDECLREIDNLRQQLSAAKESHRVAADLKQRLEIQGKELQSAREESSALKREFAQLTTLLEDRTSELKGAQSFLTTADAFSGAEVTSTLQRLNAEVLQSTAFMAESMVEQFFHDTELPRVSKTDEQLAACKRASTAIGGIIVHFLGTKKHKDDPILIQIAFQAYLTYHLRWIACAWMVGGDENHNRFIDAIYQSVQEREAQAIAGRWRALTRAHVPSTPFDDSQMAFQISTKIISGLSDILLTTGCTTPKSDLTSGFSSKFSEKLSSLVTLAMRVNKIVREEVTSGDFEVLAIPPGTAFDAATMDDSYADGEPAKVAKNMTKVLCATDLGLRKKTRIATTGERQWETKMLLKPKVALESVIDIMDD